MNRLACTIALAAVVAAVLPASLPAQNTDPINGTWKLNLAKSKFNPGPAPQSETRRYEVSGDDFKLTTDGIRQTHSFWDQSQNRRQRLSNPRS